MKTHEKIMKSYFYTGLASLAVIFCVTVLADDSDGRKPTNRARGGDERRTDQRLQSKSSQSRSSSRSRTSSQGKQQQSSRGYLGASVETSSRPRGLRIRQVYAHTAAARAKLKKGDIILKMNGSAVTSNSALIGRLSKTKPGQKATLLVSSGGKTKTVQVQLGGSYSTRSSAQSGSTRSGSSSKSRGSQSKGSQSSGSQSRRSSQQRSSQSKGNDQNRGGDSNNRREVAMDAIRKRIEAGVKSGKIKREDAHKMLEGLRKRMEMTNRGGDDRKSEGENDPRKARYQAAEREIVAAVRAGKISREEAGKRLEGLKDHLWGKDRNDKDAHHEKDDRGHHLKEAIGHLHAAGLHDLAEEAEKRIHESHQKHEHGDREHDDRKHREDRGRGDRAEAMRKAWEERVKQWREAREKAERDSRRAPQSRGSSRSRTPQRSSGTDWRKAIEERMKQAREARERAERDSRGRGSERGDRDRDDHSDRGEAMRKAWEERVKQWREMRERGGGEPDRGRGRSDFGRGGPGRGGPGSGPGANRGGPQRRGPGGPPQGRWGPGRR